MLMGRLGFCIFFMSAFLIPAVVAQAAERMSVMAEIANVRSGPGVADPMMWQVEKYHPLIIIEKKDGWYRFKDFEGDEGWISGALLDTTPTVIVKVARSNVRTGPGKDYPVKFMAERGIPFKILRTQGDWIEIEHGDGDKGWIAKTLVW
jgi:SH3-like domain-containing protein